MLLGRARQGLARVSGELRILYGVFLWQQEGEFDEFFDVSDDFSGSDVCNGAAVYGYVPAVASGVVLLFFHFHIDDADDFDDDDDRHGPGADFWRAGE